MNKGISISKYYNWFFYIPDNGIEPHSNWLYRIKKLNNKKNLEISINKKMYDRLKKLEILLNKENNMVKFIDDLRKDALILTGDIFK